MALSWILKKARINEGTIPARFGTNVTFGPPDWDNIFPLTPSGSLKTSGTSFYGDGGTTFGGQAFCGTSGNEDIYCRDQYIMGTLKNPAGTYYTRWGVHAQPNSFISAPNHWDSYYIIIGTGTQNVYRYQNGTSAVLGAALTRALADGKEFKISYDSLNIRVYDNGTCFGTRSDTNHVLGYPLLGYSVPLGTNNDISYNIDLGELRPVMQDLSNNSNSLSGAFGGVSATELVPAGTIIQGHGTFAQAQLVFGDRLVDNLNDPADYSATMNDGTKWDGRYYTGTRTCVRGTVYQTVMPALGNAGCFAERVDWDPNPNYSLCEVRCGWPHNTSGTISANGAAIFITGTESDNGAYLNRFYTFNAGTMYYQAYRVDSYEGTGAAWTQLGANVTATNLFGQTVGIGARGATTFWMQANSFTVGTRTDANYGSGRAGIVLTDEAGECHIGNVRFYGVRNAPQDLGDYTIINSTVSGTRYLTVPTSLYRNPYWNAADCFRHDQQFMYYDFGTGFFGTRFVAEFYTYITSIQRYCPPGVLFFGNDSPSTIVGTAGTGGQSDGIWIYLYGSSSGANGLYLQEIGGTYSLADSIIGNGTWYGMRLYRAGSGAYLDVYDNTDRYMLRTPIQQLFIPIDGTKTYRYFYPYIAYGTGTAVKWTGFGDNYKLWVEDPDGSLIPVFFHNYQMQRGY